MAEVMIAKCGLECTQCDAFIATKNNDVKPCRGWLTQPGSNSISNSQQIKAAALDV